MNAGFIHKDDYFCSKKNENRLRLEKKRTSSFIFHSTCTIFALKKA